MLRECIGLDGVRRGATDRLQFEWYRECVFTRLKARCFGTVFIYSNRRKDWNMNNSLTQLQEIALRIRDMREILGLSIAEMARNTGLDEQTYVQYEGGSVDLPFTFIHKCSQTFGIEMTELLEGHSAHLSNYAITRRGKGLTTAKEDGITIQNLAPMFRNKLAEPYWVRYEYSAEQQNQPIHTTTHSGQEFDLVISGTLMVRVGDRTEVLH